MIIPKTVKEPGLQKEVLDFLNNHHKMVLSFLNEESHPNSSLVLYAVDEDFNFYFGTSKRFGKYKAITKDGHVAMVVMEEKIDPTLVVDAQGIAEEIPQEKVKETLDWFVSKNPSDYYVKDAEDFVMFKITPSAVRWVDVSLGEIRTYKLDLS